MRCFALTVLVALALAGCGGQAPPPELPFAEAPSTSSAPAVEAVDERDPVVIENDEMIAFHARWVCELQRRTFPDLSDMDIALVDALAESGLSRPAYDTFVAEMAESQVIRDEVLRLYGDRCRA